MAHGYWVIISMYGEYIDGKVFGRLTNAERYAKRFQDIHQDVKILFDGLLIRRYFRGRPTELND